MWVLIAYIGLLFFTWPIVTRSPKGFGSILLYVLGAAMIILGIFLGRGIL